MARKRKKPMAAIKWSGLLKIGNFIIRVRGIHESFVTNAAVLTTPVPTAADFNTHVDELQTAQNAVALRTAGSASARNIKYNIVVDDLQKWQRYVQTLADAEADAETAINIINLSGFDVRINGVFEKPELAVKATITPGEVKLIAKSKGRGAFYNWQMSINGGTTWTALPDSRVAKLTVSGLTAGTRYYFRYRANTREGLTAWYPSVNMVIQ